MSVKKEKIVPICEREISVHAEFYDAANEVVEDCRNRDVKIRDYSLSHKEFTKDWHGVNSYDEALELMRDGYQSSVENFRGELNVTPRDGTRFAFSNNIQGFAPVVPLALQNVPNSMLDMRMKPIKAKVLDVYYYITANCGKHPSQFIKAGKAVLGSIIELEKQGYRFNLYAVQTYYGTPETGEGGRKALDMLCVKVKSSNRPLDLKRMCFPLTHPAFFRVIGFDWESKSPITRDIGWGRGHAIGYDYSKEDLNAMFKSLFGNNACYLSCCKIIDRGYDRDSIKEAFLNEAPR